MLSKAASSTILKVFGMTRPGIKHRSPGLLAMVEKIIDAYAESAALSSFNNNPIHPTPPLGHDMTQGQFLSRGLNSEFSFS